MKDVVENLELFLADESELNELCAGAFAGRSVSWPSSSALKIRPGNFGVLAQAAPDEGFVRPYALIVNDEDKRRLFGRFSTLRTEFSPLTAWCHVLDTHSLTLLDRPQRRPEFAEYEACWSGLAIAEAIMLVGRSAGSLKLATVLATSSFAVGRARGLWPHLSPFDVAQRHEACNEMIRGSAVPGFVAHRMAPIWAALTQASSHMFDGNDEIARVISRLHALRRQGVREENLIVLETLEEPAFFNYFSQLDHLGPEGRVRLFDECIQELERSGSDRRKNILAFIAGYIATVAAGGLPSLGLAEKIMHRTPEVLAWAYVVGGIGERVTWTSGFHGLGRLVVRELLRPLHLNESPSCDFSFEEAAVLVDPQLSDPFVNLQIKQQRVASVALYAGVNVLIPLQDVGDARSVTSNRNVTTRSSKDLYRLVDELWPLIEERLHDEGYISSSRNRPGITRRRTSQSKLPLDR